MHKLLKIMFLLISVAGMGHAIHESEKQNNHPKEPRDASGFFPAALWCVASETASDKALRNALNWACGHGRAVCSDIQLGGPCYKPNNLHNHASYALNDYYQKNPIPSSCVFGGAAITTTIDPSTPNCKYPSSSRGASPSVPTNPDPSAVTPTVPGPRSGTPPDPTSPFPWVIDPKPDSGHPKLRSFSWGLILICLIYVAARRARPEQLKFVRRIPEE